MDHKTAAGFQAMEHHHHVLALEIQAAVKQCEASGAPKEHIAVMLMSIMISYCAEQKMNPLEMMHRMVTRMNSLVPGELEVLKEMAQASYQRFAKLRN